MFVYPAGGGAVVASGGYRIERSLRVSAYVTGFPQNDTLYRAAGAAGNPRTWTFSCWVKRAYLGTTTGLHQMLFSAFDFSGGGTVNRQHGLRFTPTDTLEFYLYLDGAYIARLETRTQFRDTTAWYHVWCYWDTADTSQFFKMMAGVNGSEGGVFSAFINPPPNQAGMINHPSTPSTHGVGCMFSSGYNSGLSAQVFDGLIADAHFIDGQKLPPSEFGMTDPATNTWVPKRYAGTYGVNGFQMKFGPGPANTVGNDTSGNANHYTVLGFTANGSGSQVDDSFVDTPTGYGEPAANGGGEVRGNYCTLNTLDSNGASYLRMDNVLKVANAATAGGWGTARGTMWVNSGKWYFETRSNGGINGYAMYGVMGPSLTLAANISGTQFPGLPADGYGWMSNGTKYNNGAGIAFGSPQNPVFDFIGVALDLDAGTISIYNNGVLVGGGPMYTGLSGWFAPAVGVYWTVGPVNATQIEMNFGQHQFTYPAPAGFKAWCSQNLPTPAIARGDDYMAMNTARPPQTTGAYSVTGVRFRPDIVWIKNYRAIADHRVFDTSRGPLKHLSTNLTTAEVAAPLTLSSFNSDGYSSLGGDSNAMNGLGPDNGYIDMMWKEGAVPGVDVVLYTGTGAAQAVPHNLGAVPKMILTKGRSIVVPWVNYHAALSVKQWLGFDTSPASDSGLAAWNETRPTATHFTLGAGGHNVAGHTYVAYVFAEVPGFSRFGAYTANNLPDGPFAGCGFVPQWVMIKNTMSAAHPWHLYCLENSNVVGLILFPNTNEAYLNSPPRLDFLANGFKLRTNPGNGPNTPAGDVYIYAAFAERPFKYARGR